MFHPTSIFKGPMGVLYRSPPPAEEMTFPVKSLLSPLMSVLSEKRAA